MNQPEPKLDPASKSILVIDDDKPTCLLFKTLLTGEGFQVETAYSGESALSLLKSDSYEKFDLIMLDLMMPGYGGYDVLKELQQGGYQNAPIFIVTARALDAGMVEMIRSESNVREFIAKPIDIKKFKTSVHEALGTAAKEKN